MNEDDDFLYDDADDPDYENSSESESVIGEVEDDDQSDIGEGDGAEVEIEGDFDRLVANVRSLDGPSGSGLLSRDWDFNLEDQYAEFRDDLRAASGIGRGKRGRVRSGPILSPQVKAMIGEGNVAFVDNDIPTAIRIMQEVIRIEPRAASAWSVLAQCYADTGEPKRELQLRIMAAHLRHDADEWERLAVSSKALGYSQQALYCYGKLYRLDPANVDALWDRASLAKDIGDLRTARHSYLAILKRFPHDLTVLDSLRPLLIEMSDLEICASMFQAAFNHYATLFPTLESLAQCPFNQMEVLCLTDLYNTLGQYEKAIESIKQGCRWLQGRAAEKFWDVIEDDREFDVPDVDVERDGEVRPGYYPLDVNARHRLAIARIKMGDIEQGRMHANIVLSHDLLDYSPLFVEIADAYFDMGMYKEASPLYELLGEDAATSNFSILFNAATCRKMMGNLREAVDLYKTLVDADPTHNEAKMKLAELYEILDEPRKALDLVYQVIESRAKNRHAKDSDDATPSGQQPQLSLFEEGPRGKSKARKRSHRFTMAQLEQIEADKEKEVARGYKRMQDLWPLLLDEAADGHVKAKREWMLEAEKLVEMFRETKMLFLASRNNPFRGMLTRHKAIKLDDEADETKMASRLELMEQVQSTRKPKDVQADNVDIFRGLSFDNWLKIFFQYCFQLTKSGEHDLAADILRHILFSNAYQARDKQDVIRMALIAWAITTKNHIVIVEQCRKLITTHQFNNEPLRILLASLASGLRTTDSFIVSTLQKHMLRELKTNDIAVKNPEQLKWAPVSRRYALSTKAGVDDAAEEDDDIADDVNPTNEKVNAPRILTKHNPVTITVYGQMCLAAKSYQSAIFYLLHAFDYFPNDPVICLSLAIASVGRAMQRQADNRHHLIAQGMAFLSRYRTLRKSAPEGLDEIEFNFGRTFHQLGLYSHAAQHYERVLEMAETKSSLDDCLAPEAAYNLAQIYILTGATPLAEAIYRRWLSL